MVRTLVRRDRRKWGDPMRRAKALAAIADGLTMTQAARRAGMSRMTLWEWRQKDEQFRADFETTYRLGTDKFEAEATRRAAARGSPGFNTSASPLKVENTLVPLMTACAPSTRTVVRDVRRHPLDRSRVPLSPQEPGGV